jgi:hypothetical protein
MMMPAIDITPLACAKMPLAIDMMVLAIDINIKYRCGV